MQLPQIYIQFFSEKFFLQLQTILCGSKHSLQKLFNLNIFQKLH